MTPCAHNEDRLSRYFPDVSADCAKRIKDAQSRMGINEKTYLSRRLLGMSPAERLDAIGSLRVEIGEVFESYPRQENIYAAVAADTGFGQSPRSPEQETNSRAAWNEGVALTTYFDLSPGFVANILPLAPLPAAFELSVPTEHALAGYFLLARLLTMSREERLAAIDELVCLKQITDGDIFDLREVCGCDFGTQKQGSALAWLIGETAWVAEAFKLTRYDVSAICMHASGTAWAEHDECEVGFSAQNYLESLEA